MKTTIIATLFLIIGLVAGYTLSPKQTINTGLIQEKLAQISNSQLQELQMLEDHKERYLKANQIYGQIFVMFLAQLGIRIEQKEWEPLLATTEAIVNDDAIKEVPVKITPEEALKSIPGKNTASIESSEPKVAPKPTKWKPSKATLNYQQASAIKDPSPLMKKIQGSFSGTIYEIKDKEPDLTWDIIMDVNYAHDGKLYQGEARVVLSSQEQGDFSRHRSTGDNRSIQNNRNKPDALYIEVSPSDYIELNVSGNGPIYHGILYSMRGEGKLFEYKGKVRIVRN